MKYFYLAPIEKSEQKGPGVGTKLLVIFWEFALSWIPQGSHGRPNAM